MDDLISRQAVNDALDRTCNLVCQYSKKQRYSMCGACPLGSAFDAITELPTIEPKKGKWEVVDEAEPRRYGCSVCKRIAWREYNYCPNCGARMDGE